MRYFVTRCRRDMPTGAPHPGMDEWYDGVPSEMYGKALAEWRSACDSDRKEGSCELPPFPNLPYHHVKTGAVLLQNGRLVMEAVLLREQKERHRPAPTSPDAPPAIIADDPDEEALRSPPPLTLQSIPSPTAVVPPAKTRFFLTFDWLYGTEICEVASLDAAMVCRATIETTFRGLAHTMRNWRCHREDVLVYEMGDLSEETTQSAHSHHLD